MKEPSETLVRLVASEVHKGRITSTVRDLVASSLRLAFKELVRSEVKARLQSALEAGSTDSENFDDDSENAIVTTEEEIEGMMTVRAIVSEVIDPSRVDLRDAKSYCSVLVDNNNRKPLARLHFNRSQRYIGLFDGDREERVAIQGLRDIHRLSDRLKATARRYAE